MVSLLTRRRRSLWPRLLPLRLRSLGNLDRRRNRVLAREPRRCAGRGDAPRWTADDRSDNGSHLRLAAERDVRRRREHRERRWCSDAVAKQRAVEDDGCSHCSEWPGLTESPDSDAFEWHAREDQHEQRTSDHIRCTGRAVFLGVYSDARLRVDWDSLKQVTRVWRENSRTSYHSCVGNI